MLMLIDTRDPRHRPDPEPGRRRMPPPRLWLPFAGSAACIIAASLAPPLPGFVLALVALALFCDGVLHVLPPTDGLRSHRQ